MNSLVIASTVIGTFASSWLVRLPTSVDEARHELSRPASTWNGESWMRSSSTAGLAVAGAAALCALAAGGRQALSAAAVRIPMRGAFTVGESWVEGG